MIDTGLNVPASDVAFAAARLWGKFQGSSSFDVPFGTLHNFQLQCSYTLKELMDPDFLSAVAVGTEKQDFTITAQYARIRSRNLLACLGGALATSGAGASLRTDLAVGASGSIGPVVFGAQIKSNAATNAPIIGTIYAIICTQFTIDFRMRDYILPQFTGKCFVDFGSDGVSGAQRVLTLSMLGDETSDTGSVLAAPTGVSAANGPSAGIIRVQWTAVTGATSYNVYRGLSVGGPFAYAGNVTGIAAYDTGLTTGTNYYYVVTAVNGAGESVYSSVVSDAAP